MEKCPKCGHQDIIEDACNPFAVEETHETHLSDQGKNDMVKLDKILKWAKTNKEFSTTFIQSCRDSLGRFKHLSEKQRSAVENIIEKFKIA